MPALFEADHIKGVEGHGKCEPSPENVSVEHLDPRGVRGGGLTDPTSGHLKLGCQESGSSYQKGSICVGLCQCGSGRRGPLGLLLGGLVAMLETLVS